MAGKGLKGASQGAPPGPAPLPEAKGAKIAKGANGAKGKSRETGKSWAKVVTDSTQRCVQLIAKPVSIVAQQAQTAKTFDELASAYQAGKCLMLQTRTDPPRVQLDSLVLAVSRFGERLFFDELLPFACEEALKYQDLFPEPMKVITCTETVTWTRRQCLCILCNAFLCSWPGRLSQNSMSADGKMPSINFDEMLVPEVPEGRNAVCVSKCEMFLHYLAKQHERLRAGWTLAASVSFVRQAVINDPGWITSSASLCALDMQPLECSIDDAKEMLRADFANKVLGGGCLDIGCVQEEIMFACHPEMICGRLIFAPMEENEAIIMVGMEQFATPKGYAFELTCGGGCDDSQSRNVDAEGSGGCDGSQSRNVDAEIKSYVTAIDACDYRGGDPSRQFSKFCIDRELCKALAGFSVPDMFGAPKRLATGNWGAGAFRGDSGLKALIQWAAASQAGIQVLAYFPWDDVAVKDCLPPLVQRLQGRSVAELYRILQQIGEGTCPAKDESLKLAFELAG